MRSRAIRKLLDDKPIVPIWSPMCTEYCTMNQIYHARMVPEVVAQGMEHARRHLEFSTQLYEIQWRSGRYFLHPHLRECRFARDLLTPVLATLYIITDMDILAPSLDCISRDSCRGGSTRYITPCTNGCGSLVQDQWLAEAFKVLDTPQVSHCSAPSAHAFFMGAVRRTNYVVVHC